MVRLPDRFGNFFEANDNELFEIETVAETFIVTRATAFAIERELGRVPEPVSIEFDDLFGARHRVLAWQVRRITETTPVTRAAWRAFQRNRRKDDRTQD
ncbi:MAG: hypothetical protein ACRENU_08040 [Gemmatimonadaceae bacterium]